VTKFIIHCSVALLLILIAASLCPAAEDLGLITGSDKGTYYQFGLDLQKLTRPTGVTLIGTGAAGTVVPVKTGQNENPVFNAIKGLLDE
jgi:TRAP-type uncharacterized transport system substrate-binding protein